MVLLHTFDHSECQQPRQMQRHVRREGLISPGHLRARSLTDLAAGQGTHTGLLVCVMEFLNATSS